MLLTTILALSCHRGAIGGEVKRITNANEFTYFVNDVNTGTTYSGTTVYLDSDISLPESIDPIGVNSTYQFLGVFDGQGHIISDLKMNASSQYAGLFGYSKGMTVKNVVLGSSCFISSSYSGSNANVGGIIGNCYAHSGECNIENSVNMADVTFSGNISSILSLGGVIGFLYSWNYNARVKNCANYGSVTHSGTSKDSYIGGIAGFLHGLSSLACGYIQNCLNYGAITHNGTTSDTLDLGVIIGYSKYAYIENCVSAGRISTTKSSYIGSIIGLIISNIYIDYCYCASELSGYKMYGKGTPDTSSYTLTYDNATFELNETVSVGSYAGTSLVDALNAATDYYALRDYSKWLLNKEKKGVNFTINNRASPITMDSQVILLPSLASEGDVTFRGWYNDDEYTQPLQSFIITEDKTLYGRFEENTNNHTIAFDSRREGISVPSITAQFGTVVSLPSESIREHCIVAFWENEYGDNMGLSLTMPARDFTLYAVWRCTRITMPEDFADFSNIVNLGIDYYSRITVYLDSDLSLSSETLEPIGNTSIKYFLGTFDGQGHIISDLKMNASSQYTGLFGYSDGLAIGNVVLDSSCTITSSFSGSVNAFMGGIIGYCNAYNGQCNIKNNVNMADTTFNGAIIGGAGFLTNGGIVGYLSSSSSHSAYAENCANYGSITDLGQVGGWAELGGIVGASYGRASKYTYIQNCLNYGTITHNRESDDFYVGGVVGLCYLTRVENCVSAGKIVMLTTTLYKYVGSVVGSVGSNTSINYCYYTGDVGVSSINGTGTPNSTTGTPDSPANIDSELVSKLNSNATSCNWNKWFMLHLNGGSINNLTQEPLVEFQGHSSIEYVVSGPKFREKAPDL